MLVQITQGLGLLTSYNSVVSGEMFPKKKKIQYKARFSPLISPQFGVLSSYSLANSPHHMTVTNQGM